MTQRLLATLAIAASSLVLAACGPSSKPEAVSPAQTAPVAPELAASQAANPHAAASQPAGPHDAATQAPIAAGGAQVKGDKLVIQGLGSQIPAGWTPAPLSSTMRVAQFGLPGAAGAEPGEVAIYFFPTGQGGSQEANIDRWASQFTDAGGKPVKPTTSTRKSGDTEVTLVELQGSYARGVGMGPSGDVKPDQTLMIAMTEAPAGRITMQMYGPSKTVAAHRDSFIKLAMGFRPA
ncbi:MAG: hypothetical protein ABIQ90_09185 [Polaromonas sp.]